MTRLRQKIADLFRPQPVKPRSREEIDRAVRRGDDGSVRIPDPHLHLPRV
jgi:hypothetical protein